MSRHERGSSACGGSAAAASGALGTSGAGPGNKDVDKDHDDDDKDDDDDYDDDVLDGDNSDNDYDEALGEADVPPEDENSHCVHLLAGVVRTNQDYSLGPIAPLPDTSNTAPAAFRAVEMHAPTFIPLICSCTLAGSRRKIHQSVFAAYART